MADDIFLSYRRSQERKVEELANFLKAVGYRVFMDIKGLEVGVDWWKQLQDKLREVKLVIVCVSSDALSDGSVVLRELELAIGQNKLVPLYIENVKWNENLKHLHSVSIAQWDGDPHHRQVTELVKQLRGKKCFGSNSASEEMVREKLKEIRTFVETYKSAWNPNGDVATIQPLEFQSIIAPPTRRIEKLEFIQGAGNTEAGALDQELPRRAVRLRAFEIGVTTVTVGQWAEYVASGQSGRAMPADDYPGTTVLWSKAFEYPMVRVSWHEAREYTAWLSTITGSRYRLPSESEWECAARAGHGGRIFGWGDDIVPEHAIYNWSKSYQGGRTKRPPPSGPRPVQRGTANDFDLHDLHGNVKEWVADVLRPYDPEHCDGSVVGDPGMPEGRAVVRGGSWRSDPAKLRSAWREPYPADCGDDEIGFRIVREL